MAKKKTEEPEAPEVMEFVGADPAYVFGNNTFRVGDKWSNLRPGDIIEGNFDEGMEVLALEVKSVTVTTLDDALIQLGEFNHAACEGVATGRLDTNVFAKRLEVKNKIYEIYDLGGVDEATVLVTVVTFKTFDKMTTPEEEETSEGQAGDE